MSELTAMDLIWFRLANSRAPQGFYPFKARFLKRFAAQDGWDLQIIEKECWTCEGSGQYAKGESCRSCGGDGIHHTNEHWLQRWILPGAVYHVPEFCSPPHWQRGDSPKNEFHGRIVHEPVPEAAARRAYWRLLLRHEPMNFYREIIHLIQWRGQAIRTKWYFKLIRLRNKMDLFPAINPEKDDVPF